MAKADILKPFILSWEGGFVNSKYDKGGATNKGITIATYKALVRADNNKDGKIDVEDLKLLTDKQWYAVFKVNFWNKWKADDIEDQGIANLLVDWYWNSGRYGITNAQIAIGVAPDGIVGKQTIAAINNHPNKNELFVKIWRARANYFKRLNQPKNYNGWMNRLNGIQYRSLMDVRKKVICTW
jgi:lysozyme family protein